MLEARSLYHRLTSLAQRFRRSNQEIEAAWSVFADHFVREVPIGTPVSFTEQVRGKFGLRNRSISHTGVVTDGGIHVDRKNYYVHVSDVDDIPGQQAQWRADKVERI